MRPRLSSAALFLVLLILTTGLVVGCGGGDQSQQGSQNGGAEKQGNGGAGEQGGGAGNEKQRKASKPKIALGNIASVKAEREKFVLEEVRGEQLTFKLGQKAEVRLNDKEAEFQDMKEGQQAQVEYVVRQGMSVPNRARVVELFSGGGG